MSRWLVVIGVCVGLAGRVNAAPVTITVHDTASPDAERSAHAALIAHELDLRLAKITCTGCHVDASVTRLAVATTERETTVSADLDIAISDAHGVMITILSGGARAAQRSSRRLTTLRADALTAAVLHMSGKVAASLSATAAR